MKERTEEAKRTTPPDWYLGLWPAFDALLGPNAFSMLRNLAAAEAEIGTWLTARGRRPTEWLQREDLPAVLRNTSYALLSARFAATFWALRKEAAHPSVSLGDRGEILVGSDRPLAETPPRTITVSRTERRARLDLFFLVLKALADVEVLIPAEVRAKAWDRSVWSGNTTTHSSEALKKAAQRERQRAKAAGLYVKPGKRGRPKKIGQ